MSKPDIWMPLYIGDYLAATSRLTTEQHGAYLLLIMDYWMNGPLPDDDAVLAKIAQMPQDAWANASSTIRAFFKQANGKLVHSRIENELQSAKEKKFKAHEKAKIAADKRWGNHVKDAPSNAPSTSQAMLEDCPLPLPLSLNQNLNPLSSKLDPSPSLSSQAKELLDFLNLRTNQHFRHTKANLTPIIARMKEGYTLQDMKTVTMRKINDWGTDETMMEYLRPSTLYNAKNFNSYAGIL